jgi:rod shape-determining protein MreC
MAVITPDGIVGKVRDVFAHSAQVLAINDQTSGAGVILASTRIRGILRGNANGQPQIVDILADKRIQKGEVVLTAGGDQVFPRGLPVGVVEQVVSDPDRDGFINILITPAAHLDRLDEVLIITSTEPQFSPQQQQDIATSQAEKGQEALSYEEQRKASEIMAERLPGLIDPNLPHDQQPLFDNSNPFPVAHPPQAIHPDRFTPGSVGAASNAFSGYESSTDGEKPDVTPEADQNATPSRPQTKPLNPSKPSGSAAPQSQPRRHPASDPPPNTPTPSTPPPQSRNQ